MTRLTRIVRLTLGTLGAATLAISLSGCTLITTLAGGGSTPTPTPTTTSTTTTSPTATTSSPKPTQSSTATSTPTTSPTGTVFVDDVADLEIWLADQYEAEWGGAPVTVSCPGGPTLQVYDGLTYTCTATESGGATYQLTMTATNVTSDGYDVSLDRV